MIKNNYLLLGLMVLSGMLAQAQKDLSEADKSNTWLKIGLNTAVPVPDFSNTNGFGLGVDASIQFLETKASGIGVKVGFLNYFGKDSHNDVQAIPLAFMFRYYPESKGWFAGVELGYAFLNNLNGTSGGYFGRPQLGLHYDFWNYFIYYDVILTEESNVTDIHAIGLGVTYNIRFK